MIRFYIAVLLLMTSFMAIAHSDTPPNRITTVQIATATATHILDYSHYQVIGVCLWLQPHGAFSTIVSTPELDQYLPDLIVSVYNGLGDNPWLEADIAFDPESYTFGNMMMQALTGSVLSNGSNNPTPGEQSNDSTATKSVDVIGNPAVLFHYPFPHLRIDTTGFMPYFQSDLDSIPGRMGFAEDLEPNTFNPFGHYIGIGFQEHWAYEFPRDISADNNNDYKASLVIAQHAADIVTNNNLLHVVRSTSDSCGVNCAVANVVEEQEDKHEIWQELYPRNKYVKIGESDTMSVSPIGHDDDVAGGGNYVFAVWRHYRGCVQAPGKLIYSTVTVPNTIKR